MAVGHNIVPWVSSRCGGSLALLDVGMSSAYGGLPAAWRCDLGPSGEAQTAALYFATTGATSGAVRRVAPPPELCDACARYKPGGGDDRAEAARQAQAWHDCREYCGEPQGLAAAGQAAAGVAQLHDELMA